LGYVSEHCPNCGRVRVEKYSGGKHICEKCSWCMEDEEYFNWNEYRYVEDEASAGLWKAMGGKE
jgi:transcription initiation factor TFIIIB Brf1 subunit/transcription initiation factor TFIIB